MGVCCDTHCPAWAPPAHPPRPQVAGAISSLFILVVIVKLGELFQDLPKVGPHAHCTPPGLRVCLGLRAVSQVPGEAQGYKVLPRFSRLRSFGVKGQGCRSQIQAGWSGVGVVSVVWGYARVPGGGPARARPSGQPW